MPDPNTQDPQAQVTTPAAQPAAAPAGQPAGQPAAAGSAQPDIAKLVADAVASAIAPLAARLDTPTPVAPAPAGAVPDELDQEIATRQNQLAAIDRGELDISYRAAVQTALSDAVARKAGRAIVERENMRGGFVQEYNQNLAAAYQEFPELQDANSELAKETVGILNKSPSYNRAKQALGTRGREAEKVDWSSLDPTITLSAARQAHSIITRRNAGKPLSQQNTNPKAANVALEAGSGAIPSGNEDIAQLESKAIDSGNPNDWRQYIKARDARLKQQNH